MLAFHEAIGTLTLTSGTLLKLTAKLNFEAKSVTRLLRLTCRRPRVKVDCAPRKLPSTFSPDDVTVNVAVPSGTLNSVPSRNPFRNEAETRWLRLALGSPVPGMYAWS